MKMAVFCFWWLMLIFVDHILELNVINYESVSKDGLLLRAFILTYCSVSYKLTKETRE